MAYCKHSKSTNNPNCRKCKIDNSLHYGEYECYCILHELSLWGKFTEWLYDIWQALKLIIKEIIK